MPWNLWQRELATCSGNWWSRPQLCNEPTGTSVGWWVSPSCVFSGSFLSLPLATVLSACHRLIYLQKRGKIEKITCPKILQALLIEECYWLGEVIDLLHILPQFISTLRIVFALWRAVSLALFQQKKRKINMLHEATARNSPAFWKSAAGAGVAAALVSAAVWHSLQMIQTLCSSRTKTAPVFKASLSLSFI